MAFASSTGVRPSRGALLEILQHHIVDISENQFLHGINLLGPQAPRRHCTQGGSREQLGPLLNRVRTSPLLTACNDNHMEPPAQAANQSPQRSSDHRCRQSVFGFCGHCNDRESNRADTAPNSPFGQAKFGPDNGQPKANPIPPTKASHEAANAPAIHHFASARTFAAFRIFTTTSRSGFAESSTGCG